MAIRPSFKSDNSKMRLVALLDKYSKPAGKNRWFAYTWTIPIEFPWVYKTTFKFYPSWQYAPSWNSPDYEPDASVHSGGRIFTDRWIQIEANDH